MSEFDGLRKHEKNNNNKTQHALLGLGSAARASAVALKPKLLYPGHKHVPDNQFDI